VTCDTAPARVDEGLFAGLLAVVCEQDGGNPFGWSEPEAADQSTT
jgi:hypothetical protein